MRPEKALLVQEVGNHLAKSDFVFLTDYHGIDVEETSELRQGLSEIGAEFHVVKNSSLKLAAEESELSIPDDALIGPTAIVVGGDDASGVAKALRKFSKEKEKVEIKVATLGDRLLTAAEVAGLAELPNLETLRSQLLSLLNSPATGLVRLLNAPGRNFVTLLQAKIATNE